METVTKKEMQELKYAESRHMRGGGNPFVVGYLRKGNEQILIDYRPLDDTIRALYSTDGSFEGVYQKESLEEFKAKIEALLADGWQRFEFGKNAFLEK